MSKAMFQRTILLLGVFYCCSVIFYAQGSTNQTAPPLKACPQEKSENAVIILERHTDYFGITPAYKLTIYTDGRVVFVGDQNVKIKGIARGSISREKVQQLIKEFDKVNYFSLRDNYENLEDGCPNVGTDASYAYTSIQLGGKRKSVRHYLGCNGGPAGRFAVFPQELYRLEELIDETVNSKKWVE